MGRRVSASKITARNVAGGGPATPMTSLTDAAVAADVDAVRRHSEARTDLDTRQPTGGSAALIAAAWFGRRGTAKQLIAAVLGSSLPRWAHTD